MHFNQMESVYSNCLRGNLKLLYVSPERLENDAFQNVLSRLKVNLLTIDEAHCISQWGYDFRPPYLRIAEVRNLIPDVPILALTATATPRVAEDIVHNLRFKNHKVFRASFHRKNLAYNVYEQPDKPGLLLKLLEQERGSAIVYVRNRKKTRELSDILTTNKILSTFYHAGLAAKIREERQKDWTSGKIRVIVATNAFGMGIDKPDVRQVIHYDLPDCIESYFQEAGRAGRDQKPASGSLIFGKSDINRAKRRLQEAYPKIDKIRTIYNGIGNYLQIPEGSGKDLGYDFNITEFSRHYELNVLEVYNAIRLLEREGYFYYNESAGQFSKLFIPLNREELYRYMVENPASDRFIKEILRSYGGVLTDYVNINEQQLARRTEMSHPDVIKKLNYLDKIKIINYIPVNVKPQIIYAAERMHAKNILFSKENYTYLKEAAEERLQHLLHFISNNITCRSQQLLSYFGEKNSTRCGICDVCEAKNETDMNSLEFEEIKDQIYQALSTEPVHLFHLTSLLDQFPEKKVMSVIRWLLDNNTIVRLPDEKLKWQEQLGFNF